MKWLLSSNQMKQCDQNTITHFKVPSMVLMERAALGVAEEVKRHAHKQSKIAILCGAGNNGGDGFAVARLLFLAGYSVECMFPFPKERRSSECQQQMDIVEKYEIPILRENEQIRKNLTEKVYDVIVDAMFGIGLSRPVSGICEEMLQYSNQSSAYKVAIDIPSGIEATTGAILGTAFRADVTVTMGFAKTGQYLYPAKDYCGKIQVADIGIDTNSLLGLEPNTSILELKDVEALLPVRVEQSNKGTYGKLLVIAGNQDMAGAAYFAAASAYRMGVGLVKVISHSNNRDILLNKCPEILFESFSMDEKYDKIDSSLDWCDAVVFGPGVGRDAFMTQLLEHILQKAEVPVVLDADALNILAAHLQWLEQTDCEVIVTPHVAEMARLTQSAIEAIKEHPIETAVEFAAKYHITCVLKDAVTVIASHTKKVILHPFGTNGMATGGSGDILAGMIGALLAQRTLLRITYQCVSVAAEACYLHGMAGRMAAEISGEAGMIASDIVNAIPNIILGLRKEAFNHETTRFKDIFKD